MQVLQDHAAKTVPMASNHPSRPPAQPLHPRNYDQVWKNIYSNPKLYQVGQEHTVHLPLAPFGPMCHLQQFTLCIKALLSVQLNYHDS